MHCDWQSAPAPTAHGDDAQPRCDGPAVHKYGFSGEQLPAPRVSGPHSGADDSSELPIMSSCIPCRISGSIT